MEKPNKSIVPVSNKEAFFNKGIVLGEKDGDGQAFVTPAHEVPDIILRDPPGSNSFSSIKKAPQFLLQNHRNSR